MSKSILIPIAHGSEEIETVCLADTLRRAGLAVTIASVESDITLKCSRQVKIQADAFFTEIADKDFDVIVLPGGNDGAETLSQTPMLIEKIKRQYDTGKLIGAMCAAPAVVLVKHQIATDKLMTAHPAFQSRIAKLASPDIRVVVDKNLVTSQAPGTAIEFALVLIELLISRELAKQVAGPMLVK